MLSIEEVAITKENLSLLSQDLTGRQIVLRLRNKTVLEENSNPFTGELKRFSHIWRQSELETQNLFCTLLRKTDSGLFSNATYEAISVDSGNGEIEGWSLVVIDDFDHDIQEWRQPIAIDLFGFISTHLETEEILNSDVIELRILDRIDSSSLKYLRKMFELYPGSQVYHALAQEEEARKIDILKLERLDEILEDIKEIRIDRPENYTESTYWKELEFRESAKELRAKLYGKLFGYVSLEKFWFDVARPMIRAKSLIIEEQNQAFFLRNELVDESKLKPNDVFVIVRFHDKGYFLTLSWWDCNDQKKIEFLHDQTMIEYASFAYDEDPFPNVRSSAI